MTLVYVIIALTLCFVAVFVNKILQCFSFVKKRKVEPQKPVEQPKKKLALKKQAVLHFTKTKKFLCSQKICAKFLFEKQHSSNSFAAKSLANKIYYKLQNNTILFSQNVNFKMLNNAGFSKPVFILKNPTKTVLEAVELVKLHVDFCPVFQNLGEIETNAKQIFLEDLNLKLFQELCKINLNYCNLFNAKFKLPKTDVFGKVGNVKRVFSCGEISYCLTASQNGKVGVVLRLENEMFNITKQEKNFELNFQNGRNIKYFSNKKISKVQRIKQNFENFLVVEFSAKLGEKVFLTHGQEIENFATQTLNEKIQFLNLFGLKIYTKNFEFNNFFNKILPCLIEKQLKQKNFVKQSFEKFSSQKQIANFLGIEADELNKTPLKLFGFIVENVFGIKRVGSKLYVLKPQVFEYKIICFFEGVQKQVYVKQSEKKQLEIGSVVFSNVSYVDLSVLNLPAKLCI